MDIQDVLRELVRGEPLSEQHAHWIFERILSGQADAAQIGSALTAIAMRGPTIDELVAGARAMRRYVTPVEVPQACIRSGARLIDTCGTGGAPKTFNVSTAAAIITAAAAPGKIIVAKHGSRSRTGRGSAEVMEKLGVNIAASPQTQARCLEEVGVCFSFAIQHHPAMRHAAGPRRSLGFPTIFNILGPLANPAGASRQLIGTYSEIFAQKMAEALARLGTERTMVVTSHDGLDELTTTNTNATFTIVDGVITARIIDPVRLGLTRATFDQLAASSLDEASQVVRATIEGRGGPALDIVLLNVGAALLIGEVVESIEAGIALARETVNSGAATRTFDALKRLSNEA